MVRVHKARENADGSFSIGKTWTLSDLSAIESFAAANRNGQGDNGYGQSGIMGGFVVTMGKSYYWQADTEKEKDYFIGSLVKIYRKFTNGKVPRLLGFNSVEVQQILGATVPETARSATPQGVSDPAVQSRPGLGGTISSGGSYGPPRPPDLRRPSRDHLQTNTPRLPPEQKPGQGAPGQGLGLTSSSNSSVERIGQYPNGRTSEETQSQQRPTMASRAASSRYDIGPGDRRPTHEQRSERPTNNAALGRPGGPEEMSGPRRPSVPHTDTSDSRRPSIPHTDTSGPRRPSMPHTETSDPRRPSIPHTGSSYGGPRSERLIPNRSAQGSPSPYDQSSARSTPTDMQRESQERPHDQRQAYPPGLREPGQPADRPLGRERLLREGSNMSQESVRSTNDSLRPPPRMTKIPLGEDRRGTPDTADASSFASERSDRATPPPDPIYGPPPAPAAAAAAAPAATPSDQPQEQEAYRPGLGPMIKKKSNRDVATTFRKAATAYNAFRPRPGGAGDLVREREPLASKEPDGITAVVPAPSRGITPRTSDLDIRPKSAQRQERTPSTSQDQRSTESRRGRLSGQRSSESSSLRRSEEHPRRPPSAASGAGQLDPASKTRPTPQPNDYRASRSAQLISTIGINPAVLEGANTRQTDGFLDVLNEFGWSSASGTGAKTSAATAGGPHSDPKQHQQQHQRHQHQQRERPTIETLKADIRKEIEQVEAGSWLWQLDQKDDRVLAVEESLDETIAKCDELDGLLSLYMAEMDVSGFFLLSSTSHSSMLSPLSSLLSLPSLANHHTLTTSTDDPR